MKTVDRIHLFEFEDLAWFPSKIRTSATNLIIVLLDLLKVHPVVKNKISELREELKFEKIVDLGSGSGGMLPEVISAYNKENANQKLKLELTDLYPNPSIIDTISASYPNEIQYLSESVDARKPLQNGNKILKTMMNSFHHMPPNFAQDILTSSYQNKESILIYEMAENKIPLIIWWLFLPVSLVILSIMTLFMTPKVRPFTMSQFLFTYIIPIIPIIYAWDGQVSAVRMYTEQDFLKLTKGLEDGYQWQYEVAKDNKGKKKGYFFIGMPISE